MLLTPLGHPAVTIEPLMLLAKWAIKLKNDLHVSEPTSSLSSPIIFAGMGHPSYPLNAHIAKAAIQYWSQFLNNLSDPFIDQDLIVLEHPKNNVIDYGDLHGDEEARITMAKALSKWYGSNITKNHILFSVGGVSALHIIFNVLNKKYNHGFIITPFPHYCLYPGSHKQNNLYPIHVMQSEGYQLTADLLKDSLQRAYAEAEEKRIQVSAFLLCDPNNPLGTVLDEKELPKIAEILRQYPHLFIILDEAYAEMQLDGKKHVSLLTVAPDLGSRMIIIRSATKALSAAGERMAVLMTLNEMLIDALIQESANLYCHPPRSLQSIYAIALDTLEYSDLLPMNLYYSSKVTYVIQRLREMGAALPDQTYQVRGAFYVVGNFNGLVGSKMPTQAQQALPNKEYVETDEDIAYYLLFNYGLMIAPLSYFGLSPKLGYMRITCSAEENELVHLMDRLEAALRDARLSIL